MTSERNAPCPCGSGKKYKKCCAVVADAAKPDNIGINRLIAYKGQVGRQRKQFCVEYSVQKKAGIAALENKLSQDLAANNKTTACARGCSQCCRLFVVASLQECEVIVHYLYNHEEILAHFLRSFDAWKDRIARITRCFKAINDLYQQITTGEVSAENRQRFENECGLYAKANIPCPFLKDDACSIYEVRPYVCAGVVTVSPPEWCSVNHPRHPEAVYLKSSMGPESVPPYLTLPAAREIIASMPSLVFNLLYDGYNLLATVPGLEGLRNEVVGDPEVQAALAGRQYSAGMGGYAKQ